MNFGPRDVTIWQRDATALLQAFGAGTTSPLEAVEAILDRVGRLDQVPNAYTALSGTLRDKAAAATRRWAEGRPAGPLDGLPVIVKNNLVSAGLPTAWGNAALARRPCPADERPVAALHRAGALVIGQGQHAGIRAGGLHRFFATGFFIAARSSICSASSFLSSPFSSSSAFSRFTSDTVMPPNLAFQL